MKQFLKYLSKNKIRIFYKLVKEQAFLVFLLFFLSLGYIFSLATESCLWSDVWCGQDMDQYVDYSDSLLSGHGFSAQKVTNMYFIDPKKEHIYVPEILRLPAYPLVLSIGRVFYDKPLLALVYNIFFYIMILFYSFKLTRIFLVPKFGLLAFGLIAFSSTLVFYTSRMGNADVFAGFTVIGFSFHLLGLLKGRNLRINLLLASLLGILSIFSRQNTSVFIFPLIATFIIHLIWHNKKKQVKYLALLLLIILLPMAMWMYRNFTLTNKPFLFSALSGMQLFSEQALFSPYQDDATKKLCNLISVENGIKYIASFRKQGYTVPEAYASYDEYVRKTTWTYIIRNPVHTIKHFIFSVSSFYSAPPYNWDKKDILFYLKNIDVYINRSYIYLMLLFPLIYLKNKNTILINIWACLSLFIYISAFFHGVVVGNRGILPVLPLVIIFSMLFIQTFSIKWVTVKKWIIQKSRQRVYSSGQKLY